MAGVVVLGFLLLPVVQKLVLFAKLWQDIKKLFGKAMIAFTEQFPEIVGMLPEG